MLALQHTSWAAPSPSLSATCACAASLLCLTMVPLKARYVVCVGGMNELIAEPDVLCTQHSINLSLEVMRLPAGAGLHQRAVPRVPVSGQSLCHALHWRVRQLSYFTSLSFTHSISRTSHHMSSACSYMQRIFREFQRTNDATLLKEVKTKWCAFYCSSNCGQVHASSSGLKSMCTTLAATGMEVRFHPPRA